MADLDAFIDARRNTPFEYFLQDCAHIAADWVFAKTGADPLADLRSPGGPFEARNLLAALRLVRAAGGYQAMATQRLGADLPPLLAQRGDVMLVMSGRPVGRVRGFTFGVCTGSHIAAPDNDGLVFLPITSGVAAWRV
ncbi:DUF6950 family protein [Variovorax sp. UMC13]|uniref:DUF6950 family protein n=1 Tax=Variovorax sp. UMC13 TaxID=1862326 RepID=UPI0016007FF5|nr:hypothetical protein [Variovorax sp. UMC13]MBB1601586.1 hypothetical protein [Variovorax sp. UMC13]